VGEEGLPLALSSEQQTVEGCLRLAWPGESNGRGQGWWAAAAAVALASGGRRSRGQQYFRPWQWWEMVAEAPVVVGRFGSTGR